ncbi:lariat debranching enzyme b [Plasmopara halstedii]|uniref:Lariat debranching enzyme b n=1 Tax=Plasmopara halstedii TaxID=4781 RepID=A0A0P1AIE7_PLAHL|nr:lariat debranching enzyme b [Plasmopara halstedii]CEG40805.1 lariat debranching enzyme b [Plasmopara halstedii]|eukprot:XP_024577174.1 lariat debranching enzyme b [Plasmopara halstedii]
MVRVAVVGCAHGMLDDIYATLQFVNQMNPDKPVRLLLCCGDFECMRNTHDLETLACPPKYRAMHAFHRYYKKEKIAPVLTIFIGGNHEASGYLKELHYGGWVAPNMFYLGAAGVINVAGLRIAGLSGIYKQQHYTAGHFESQPFDNNTMRSVYHIRELEVYQLSHVQQVDKTSLGVFLSHDWPRGVEQHGNVSQLLRRKPFFEQEIRTNTLGNPADHPVVGEDTEVEKLSERSGQKSSPQPAITKFLALDKCLPRREFMQVLDLPCSRSDAKPAASISEPMGIPAKNFFRSSQNNEFESPRIMFDLEWLAILRATHHLASSSKFAPRVPQDELKIERKDIEWVRQRLQEFVVENKLNKVEGEWITDFVKTVPGYGEEAEFVQVTGNPQTDLLLELLQLPHVVTAPFVGGGFVKDPNEINLDDDDEDDVEDNIDDVTAINTEVTACTTSSTTNLMIATWVREAAKRTRQPHFGPALIYEVNQTLLDSALQSAFVQLNCDEETQAFLLTCTGGSLWESLSSTLLGLFYSLTDVNGILGRGQMFVLSQAQVQRLIQRKPLTNRSGSLLDIGAGDGNVTTSLASLVEQVTTTEVSAPMVANLNARGYNSIQTCDLEHDFVQSRKPFDIISLLNVLDRADKPLTMLRTIRTMLEPQNGIFLLAVVLPFAAFVEQGTQRVAPTEKLPMHGGLCAEGASFETSASLLLRNVLVPAGFKLRHFSRVPYLCRGDIQQPYYVLSDAIFVLEVDHDWRANEAS